MKIRTISLVGLALCLLAAISTNAQQRFEITPFVGYETSASYPLTNVQIPSGSAPVDRLRVNDATAFGTFLDYNLTENFQLEFMWNRNNTSYSARDILSNSYIAAYHSIIDQYQFGGLYMFRSSEQRLRPYMAGSVGFTHDSNSNNTPNRTEFSFSVGGGLKYALSRHLGLRGDIRYLPTYGSSSDALYCYFGCYTATVRNFLNRASFTGGIILKF
jgi:opacity protein-like surface antigen